MRLLFMMTIASFYLFASTITLPENFTAHFTQKITNAKNKVIHYSGNVRFTNHSLLKWEYLEPTQKEVCTNGLELLVVDHDLEQVSTYMMRKGFNLTEILKNARLYKNKIYVADYQGKKYTIQVDKNGKLQSVAYFDELENKVQIVFTKVKYAKGNLKASTMKCNYPNNYDIIRG